MIKMNKAIRTLCAAYLSANMAVSDAQAADGSPVKTPYITLGGLTSQPVGHRDFCSDLPAECSYRTTNPLQIIIDQNSWNQLIAVNNRVNSITPKTDLEIYGRAEYWNFPQGEADCEDFAIQKRKDLIDLGWPPSSLLIAVVRNHQLNGEGHAVLLANTDRGTFVLDNLEGRILRWDEIPHYEFLKTIDPRNNAQWLAVVPGHAGYTASVPAP
jgi:predicted transglutaminase-like cysteine proteinase